MEKDKQRIDEENLRRKIIEINHSSLSTDEKARKIQNLMTAGFRRSRPDTPPTEHLAALENAALTDDDTKPTYQDEALRITGCKHYRRSNRLQASCCGRWFTCRFCHDEGSDHQIVRQHTKNMLCMQCRTPQPAAQRCAVQTCGALMARYYCDRCKLWDDDPNKNIYHCNDCGICRVGKGLGLDYFHCDKCNICMMISLKENHRCIERNLESDCPICGEFMFNSTSTVIFMPCGHCIHDKCHSEYIVTSYQCPTCLKSLGDMSDYFARIDAVLARERMPPEYEDYVSNILCNDCERRSQSRYHFIYNKCAYCRSYNTSVLTTVKRGTGESLSAQRPENNYPLTDDDDDEDDGDDDDDDDDARDSTAQNLPELTSWTNFFSPFGGGEGSR